MAKFYGVSVGVGDPELMTLKAVKLLNKVNIIAAPGNIENSYAYKIAKENIENIDEKLLLSIEMPMTKDENILQEAHKKGADIIEEYLKKGSDIAFLVIGDVSIYSTYIYIQKIIENRGYECELISGIPSFVASAASICLPLAENDESLHIIPASYDIKEALKLKGTKVFMKAGTKFSKVKEELKKLNADIYAIENCGFENERVFYPYDEIPDNLSYLSLVIVKDKR